jgi:hypothetical protein
MAERGKLGADVRAKRIALKQEIRQEGVGPLVGLLYLHPVPKDFKTMGVEELLCALPRMNAEKADELLEGIPVRLTAELGALTYRKRRLLIDRLTKGPAGKSGKRALRVMAGMGSNKKFPKTTGFPKADRIA